ncbi:MAG: hypothetical protein BWY75_03782 [bacterium ADurb.Bin425]|nr:MAG: hypothetical protein BWY75_03782 [bacterium ADurb.Bin425]
MIDALHLFGKGRKLLFHPMPNGSAGLSQWSTHRARTVDNKADAIIAQLRVQIALQIYGGTAQILCRVGTIKSNICSRPQR